MTNKLMTLLKSSPFAVKAAIFLFVVILTLAILRGVENLSVTVGLRTLSENIKYLIVMWGIFCIVYYVGYGLVLWLGKSSK